MRPSRRASGTSDYVIQDMEVEDSLEPFEKPYLVTLYDVQVYDYEEKILIHQFERLVKSEKDSNSMCFNSSFWVVDTDMDRAIDEIKSQLRLVGKNPVRYGISYWNPRG